MSNQASLPGMQGLVKTAIQAKGRPRCSKSITCKLDPSRYVAIRLAAIDTGLSHQAILVRAFDAWLKNHELSKAKSDEVEKKAAR